MEMVFLAISPHRKGNFNYCAKLFAGSAKEVGQLIIMSYIAIYNDRFLVGICLLK